MAESNTNQSVRISDVGEIGRALRAARKAQGLTQREFADISGVGVRFLSELERGKPTAEVGLVLEVLADAGYDIVLQKRQLSSFGGAISGEGSQEDGP
jgi:y4mF family transcriptional regulator